MTIKETPEMTKDRPEFTVSDYLSAKGELDMSARIGDQPSPDELKAILVEKYQSVFYNESRQKSQEEIDMEEFKSVKAIDHNECKDGLIVDLTNALNNKNAKCTELNQIIEELLEVTGYGTGPKQRYKISGIVIKARNAINKPFEPLTPDDAKKEVEKYLGKPQS